MMFAALPYRSILLFGLVCLSGCKASAPSLEPSSVAHPLVESKTQAPMAIDFVLQKRKGIVSLRATDSLDASRVEIFGTSGLRLLADVNEELGGIPVGTERSFEVRIDPNAANGLVTVVVETAVGPNVRGKTVAFEVGNRALERSQHRMIDGRREKDYRIDP